MLDFYRLGFAIGYSVYIALLFAVFLSFFTARDELKSFLGAFAICSLMIFFIICPCFKMMI